MLCFCYSELNSDRKESIMGERTAMLVRVYDKDKKGYGKAGKLCYSTILYYQWGFGRVMLEDAMHLAAAFRIQDRVRDFVKDRMTANELLDRQMKLTKTLQHMCGDLVETISCFDSIQDYVLDCKSNNRKPFMDTHDDLFHCDNNDGFMELDFTIDHNWQISVNLSFWQDLPLSQKLVSLKDNYTDDKFNEYYKLLKTDRKFSQCTLEQYLYWSDADSTAFATPQWVRAYHVMLDSYGFHEAMTDPVIKTPFNRKNSVKMSFNEYNKACHQQL